MPDLDEEELKATLEMNQKRIKYNCEKEENTDKGKIGKEAMLLRLEHIVAEELAILRETTTDKTELLSKGNVLFNLHKYLSNYDDLEPVLTNFFTEKHNKEKFEELGWI